MTIKRRYKTTVGTGKASAADGFQSKVLGVRGSIACPTANHLAFGGNTSCIEVSAGGTKIILDAGTGIRNLGTWFMRKDVKHATILMSHTHWDHINGFPFFVPAFDAGYSFHVMAGHLADDEGIREVLDGQMAQPMFPVPIEAMQGEMTYQDFRAGESFTLPADSRISIKTAPLNHPNGATGYRVDFDGRAICYVTDTEHKPGEPDSRILDLIEGADIVVYDSTYTDEEFPRYRNWGHSTWQEGARLCDLAGARQLVIFHHDPGHDDGFMDDVAAAAEAARPGTQVASEGLVLRP